MPDVQNAGADGGGAGVGVVACEDERACARLCEAETAHVARDGQGAGVCINGIVDHSFFIEGDVACDGGVPAHEVDALGIALGGKSDGVVERDAVDEPKLAAAVDVGRAGTEGIIMTGDDCAPISCDGDAAGKGVVTGEFPCASAGFCDRYSAVSIVADHALDFIGASIGAAKGDSAVAESAHRCGVCSIEIRRGENQGTGAIVINCAAPCAIAITELKGAIACAAASRVSEAGCGGGASHPDACPGRAPTETGTLREIPDRRYANGPVVEPVLAGVSIEAGEREGSISVFDHIRRARNDPSYREVGSSYSAPVSRS